ncbi:hypothetical protein [Iningainema tapete]|uniref:Glycerophosphoryl diester phosphodiesterase membrane domain-containing protein n=1 Tax=Iningainema tapete BLCC-T55 TaxID=2748662 RepID=A0A8J6XQV7_9CYAN|nr:hypothetical protein [Iningainema tapete]MBD2775731.1 hypothetical protein [Iningainema tapete BLCC-T55]
MSENFRSPNLVELLSLGNVVTAGFRLYSSHRKSYFLLALTASFWSFLPFLFIIPVGILIFINSRVGNDSLWAWLIAMLVGIILYFYALGKSLINASIISRLAFAELLNQPETVAAARRQVKPKLWRFVITSLLIFLILFVSFIVFMILMIIPLLNLLLFIPALATFLWVVARFLLPDVILAVEENSSAIDAVSRSWDLTSRNAWRIVLILVVAFLVTIPLQLLVQIINRVAVYAFITPVIRDAVNGSTSATLLISIVYLFILVLIFLVNAIILPFWQAIKGVIYYDLRARQEGLDLKLRGEV